MVSHYATAVRKWRPLAEAGDAAAQYNLGVIFDQGRGVPRDTAEALRWYQLAAAQGYAAAQTNYTGRTRDSSNCSARTPW